MHQHESYKHNIERSQILEHRMYASIYVKFKTRQNEFVWLEVRIVATLCGRVNRIAHEGCFFWDAEMFYFLIWVLFQGYVHFCEISSSYTLMTVHFSVCMPYFNKFTLNIHFRQSIYTLAKCFHMFLKLFMHFFKKRQGSINGAMINTQREIDTPICNPDEIGTVPIGDSHRNS